MKLETILQWNHTSRNAKSDRWVANGPFPISYPTTSSPLAWTPPISNLGLHFDLNYTHCCSVKPPFPGGCVACELTTELRFGQSSVL